MCVKAVVREHELSLEKFFSVCIINGGISGYQAKFTNVYNSLLLPENLLQWLLFQQDKAVEISQKDAISSGL